MLIDWLRSNWWIAYLAVLIITCALQQWRIVRRRRGLDISEVDRRRRG